VQKKDLFGTGGRSPFLIDRPIEEKNEVLRKKGEKNKKKVQKSRIRAILSGRRTIAKKVA